MKYLFITILLCFLTIITRAQLNPSLLSARQVDSLHAVQARTSNDTVNMELDAIFSIYYFENNRDSALYFLNLQLALATKLNIPLWKAEALSFLGSHYTWLGDYPKALQSLNTAQGIAGEKASEKNIYQPRFIIGIPAWFANRECLLSFIYLNTATLYRFTYNNDKAASVYTEAIRMAERIGDRESLPVYYMDASLNSWYRNKHDSAYMLMNKALALSKGTQWQYFTGRIYVLLGQIYRETGNSAAALPILRQSININRQQQNLGSEGESYNTLSQVFLDMHQPDSAVIYSKKARLFFTRVKVEFWVAETYEHLSDAYRMKGNIDSAYTYLQLSAHIKDSVYDLDRTRGQQYQVLNFNEQLRTQERENQRARQQSKMITYITLAGLLVTFLLAFLLYRNNRQKQKTNTALAAISDLQDKKITQLDEAVTKRTEQLNTFRQAMATDFHDQTGNMLSAITRQASLLKLKLTGQKEVLPIVDSIITNSNELYDSSKDFLWNLNHNSDDPLEVFQYLTGYGQVFYNQFRIPFSSTVKGEGQSGQQLEPFAALNLIYIFKEAMTNVVKHAEANEVVFEMENTAGKVVYSLHDDGRWKPKDETTSHYGLRNIERRCERNNFGFLLSRQDEGTKIEITATVKIDFM